MPILLNLLIQKLGISICLTVEITKDREMAWFTHRGKKLCINALSKGLKNSNFLIKVTALWINKNFFAKKIVIKDIEITNRKRSKSNIIMIPILSSKLEDPYRKRVKIQNI